MSQPLWLKLQNEFCSPIRGVFTFLLRAGEAVKVGTVLRYHQKVIKISFNQLGFILCPDRPRLPKGMLAALPARSNVQQVLLCHSCLSICMFAKKRQREVIPKFAVKSAACRHFAEANYRFFRTQCPFWCPFAPLLEEEWDSHLRALISQGACPGGLHRTCARTTLATHNHPINTQGRVELNWPEQWLAGKE